jgi:uncharacterized coiled-coil protein SlyX
MNLMEQFMVLEKRVASLETKLDTQYRMLEAINESLKTLVSLEAGIYGDKKNRQEGLVDRVKSLEDKIKEMEKMALSDEVSSKAKKSTWSIILEVIKWSALGYLVAKGVFGFDTIFGKWI